MTKELNAATEQVSKFYGPATLSGADTVKRVRPNSNVSKPLNAGLKKQGTSTYSKMHKPL